MHDPEGSPYVLRTKTGSPIAAFPTLGQAIDYADRSIGYSPNAYITFLSETVWPDDDESFPEPCPRSGF